MDDAPPLAAEVIREQLRYTYDLFADIRRKFDGPGVERGGHERIGFTPVYLKKFGAYAEAILGDVKQYTVEASFSDEQMNYVNMMSWKRFFQSVLQPMRGGCPNAGRAARRAERISAA